MGGVSLVRQIHNRKLKETMQVVNAPIGWGKITPPLPYTVSLHYG
ncbi:hypothetical protein [Leptolyngbya sp. Heron Island J]|nr:hypothetical protein [Leptolyngbya sp. Heron Island J]